MAVVRQSCWPTAALLARPKLRAGGNFLVMVGITEAVFADGTFYRSDATARRGFTTGDDARSRNTLEALDTGLVERLIAQSDAANAAASTASSAASARDEGVFDCIRDPFARSYCSRISPTNCRNIASPIYHEVCYRLDGPLPMGTEQ